MTHVSRVRLDKDTYDTIRKNLRGAVSLKSIRGSELLESLLTRSERIMLAKRLAVIHMLERDASYYKISRRLKVSVSTVSRIDRNRKNRHFLPIQKALASRRTGLSLVEHLELLLAVGGPSIAGPAHTKRLKRLRAAKYA